jgi:type I restriction enzyme S subunit
LTLHQGLNTAGEKVKFYDSGFPIIQTRNIDNGIIDITEKLKFLSIEDWVKYKDKFKPEIGDVFFTNIGTIGKTAIVKNVEDYLIHWNIFKIRPKFNLITSKFMKLALDYLTLSGYFSDRQKGGTVEFVTKKMISEVSLPIPSLTSQIELTNKHDNVFEFCELLKESYLNKLNELQKLKASILRQAFNGELVKE